MDRPPRSPRRLSLAPPVPNPMRDAADVRFALPVAGFVTVAVFDAGGRRVRDLEAGHLPAGEHALRWDGRDTGGQSTASGTYFVRLETGQHTLTRPIVRVR